MRVLGRLDRNADLGIFLRENLLLAIAPHLVLVITQTWFIFVAKPKDVPPEFVEVFKDTVCFSAEIFLCKLNFVFIALCNLFVKHFRFFLFSLHSVTQWACNRLVLKAVN